MRNQNLPLLTAVAALALAGATLASRIEAERTTIDQAAAPSVALDDSGRVRAEVDFLEGVIPAEPPSITQPTSPSLGLTDSVEGYGDGRSDETETVEPTVVTSTDSTATADATPPTPLASTTTLEAAPSTSEPEQLDWSSASVGDRGLDALTMISFPWKERLPEWEIRFHEGREGAYGYTLTQESIIDIYVRDGQSRQLLAHVIAHELGHAVDVTHNSGDDRRRWQEARGIENAPWWPDNRASDFSTGAGDFAESFAAWQVGTDSYRSRLAGPPEGDQLSLLAELAAG